MDLLNDFELLKSVFEDIPEGVLVLDDEDKIFGSNTISQFIFGYSQDEFEQKAIDELIPSFLAKINNGQTTLWGLSKSKKTEKSIKTWGTKKDGSQVPLELKWIKKKINGQRANLIFIRDITAEELMAQEFRAKAAKHAALLEAHPDMVFVLNYKGEYLDFYIPENREAPIPREQIIGSNLGKVFPPKRFPKLHTAFKRSIAKRKNQEMEFQMKENGQKYYEARFIPANNHSILGIIREVTKGKQLENELRNEKERLQRYLNMAASMFVVISRDHTIRLVNEKACEILGWDREQLLGKDWFRNCIPKEERKTIRKMFDDIMEGRRSLEEYYENHIISKDGRKRLIRWRNTVLTDASGNTIASLSSGVDITERKATLDMLHLRNRALEAAGNGILIADALQPDTPIIFSNAAFQKMTGYSEEEVLGRNCRFLQNDDRDQEAIAIMKNAIDKGEECQVELRNYKKDGTRFWNNLTITPVHDKKGNLTHFIGVQSDITQRKQEEQLKDKVRHILEMAAKNSPLQEIAKEIIEGIEEHIDDSFASISVVTGNTLQMLAAPNLPESFVNEINGVSIGPKKCSCSMVVHSKKEVIVENIAVSEHWQAFRELALQNNIRAGWSIPIMDSQGAVLGTFAIYAGQTRSPKQRELEVVKDMAQLTGLTIEHHMVKKDLEHSQRQLKNYADSLENRVLERTDELRKTIDQLIETNQKLTEQTQLAKTNQEMFSAIAKNFPKGVIMVFDANMEFVFIEGEELARIDLGRDDFEGKNITELSIFSENRMKRIKSDIQKTLNGQHLSFEIDYGTEVYAVNSAPLYAEEDTVLALFVYSNITEQKRVETEIRKNLKKEKELSELKSRFVSMASHEFRTPLSAILSSAILIEKQNAPDKVEKRKKYVNQIKSNVRNLVIILNDFLSLGKLEEGKTISQPEYFNLLELTRSLILEMTTDKKEMHKIELKHEGKPTLVFLDPKLIRHILINLISNAMKYSKIDTSVLVGLVFRNDSVSIQVKDEGMGIPIGEQEHLFERFFRARNADNIQGTGLGLHIVKQYTELMGGEVGFTSKEGMGTTFTLTFPIKATVEAE